MAGKKKSAAKQNEYDYDSKPSKNEGETEMHGNMDCNVRSTSTTLLRDLRLSIFTSEIYVVDTVYEPRRSNKTCLSETKHHLLKEILGSMKRYLILLANKCGFAADRMGVESSNFRNPFNKENFAFLMISIGNR